MNIVASNSKHDPQAESIRCDTIAIPQFDISSNPSPRTARTPYSRREWARLHITISIVTICFRREKRPGPMQGSAVNQVRSERKQP